MWTVVPVEFSSEEYDSDPDEVDCSLGLFVKLETRSVTNTG